MANISTLNQEFPVTQTGVQTSAPAATTTTVVGNDYVAQTPPGTNPAGTVIAPPTMQAPTVQYTPPPVTQAPAASGSGQVVQGYLNDLLSQDSAYMRNATSQGIASAAARGLRNSSIASGNAQAAAIDASTPILNQIMSLNNQREQNAFSGEQSQFDRNLTTARDNANMALTTNQQNANMALQTQQQNAQQAYQAEQAALNRTQGVNDRILASELASRAAAEDFQFKAHLQDSAAKQQDWLSSSAYNREFNGMLSQMQVSTAADLYKQIMSAALNDPESFPPDVTAGMQNFFTGNFAAVMQKYFPSTVRS